MFDIALGDTGEMPALPVPDVLRAVPAAGAGKMAKDCGHCKGAALLDRYVFTVLRNCLPDDILAKVDRASMFHSLEVRCLLMDHERVKLTARIPWRLELQGRTGKRLLRKLLSRYVPRALFERPKRGWGVPLSAWFRNEWKDALSDLHASLWRALFFTLVKC